jgi:uncharacterized protein (DUF433 family)
MRSSPSDPAQQEVLAFSADQVRKLTGLTVRQLRYWDHTEFFSPEHAPGYRSGAFTRIYSFRDVVGLSAIATLRNEHQFPLQKLRLVGAYLKRFHDTPWASLALYVAGREILFREPGRPEPYTSTSSPDQVVFSTIELQEVARNVQSRAERLRRRQEDQVGQVERRRHVVRNLPVLAGTRVPTSAIWNLRAAGYTTEQILREYPRLQPPDVTAAVEFERRSRSKKAG